MMREDSVKRDIKVVKIYHICHWEQLAKVRNEWQLTIQKAEIHKQF
jgi:hypothetical protein